ncbi:MAG TPA: hypothetical protein VHF69_12420 [Candidatus Synoicihabitans sp.]|nr:hypothetical protein [Candidatus Synoicihabitans sp.]
MTTSSTATLRPPMHIMRQLVFRLRPKQPHNLALDVIEQQVDRESAEIAMAAREARAIETGCHRLRRQVSAALRDDGVIDENETRVICRTLLDTSAAAHHHTKHLEALA